MARRYRRSARWRSRGGPRRGLPRRESHDRHAPEEGHREHRRAHPLGPAQHRTHQPEAPRRGRRVRDRAGGRGGQPLGRGGAGVRGRRTASSARTAPTRRSSRTTASTRSTSRSRTRSTTSGRCARWRPASTSSARSPTRGIPRSWTWPGTRRRPAGLVLQEAFMWRHTPQAVRLREVLPQVGDIVSRARDVRLRPRGRLGHPRQRPARGRLADGRRLLLRERLALRHGRGARAGLRAAGDDRRRRRSTLRGDAALPVGRDRDVPQQLRRAQREPRGHRPQRDDPPAAIHGTRSRGCWS